MGRSRTRNEVWRFLRKYMADNAGRPPTAREIMNGAGLRSLSLVHMTLGELEREGKIRRGRFGEPRGVRIVGATYRLPEDEPAVEEAEPAGRI